MVKRMFVGRQAELAMLRDDLDSVERERRARFLAIRGRRRVGKSTLVEEFLATAGVPYAFFTATRQPLSIELDRLCATLAESSHPVATQLRAGVVPTNWEAALRLVADSTPADSPAVLVIDEFPYLVEQDESIEGVLQVAWDQRLSRVPALLCIVGSDLGMMESLTEYNRPLHGRPTREMVITPLSPAEIGDLLGLEPAPALDAYMVIGGFPQLAMTWGRGMSQGRFLRASLNDYSSPLIVDGERAVSAEFPPETQARRVLSAIGAGETAHNKIQRRARISGSALSHALETLEAKRAVRRLLPFGAKPESRATRYVIADPYLRFWHRFIEPGLDLIERGRGDVVVAQVKEAWSGYRGKAIEPLVQGSVERMLPDERFGGAQYVSGYWTRDNLVEVDLVGGDRRTNPRSASFVGSIKWRERSSFGRADLADLRAVIGSVPKVGSNTKLLGVSRSGFANGLGLDIALTPKDLVHAWR